MRGVSRGPIVADWPMMKTKGSGGGVSHLIESAVAAGRSGMHDWASRWRHASAILAVQARRFHQDRASGYITITRQRHQLKLYTPKYGPKSPDHRRRVDLVREPGA
jgi:hypothetical protein